MPDTLPRADLLETIVAATRRAVATREAAAPPAALASRAAVRPRAGTFRAALASGAKPRVIAECKRRSPSRGVLRRDYEPAAIARGYERAGAAAISVLTEPAFFDGSMEHLIAVRGAVSIPVLRKDFIVSEYQLLEARTAGADAVLLIVAAVDEESLRDLIGRARALGLDALVEVHDGAELARAVSAGAEIVGVNNRNLRTLEVRLEVTHALAARMPPGVITVAESGLRTRDDVAALTAAGYDAFLLGERLMTAADPGAALAELMGSARGRRG